MTSANYMSVVVLLKWPAPPEGTALLQPLLLVLDLAVDCARARRQQSRHAAAAGLAGGTGHGGGGGALCRNCEMSWRSKRSTTSATHSKPTTAPTAMCSSRARHSCDSPVRQDGRVGRTLGGLRRSGTPSPPRARCVRHAHVQHRQASQIVGCEGGQRVRAPMRRAESMVTTNEATKLDSVARLCAGGIRHARRRHMGDSCRGRAQAQY